MNTIQDQLTAAEAAIQTGNFAQAETISRALLAQELQPEEKATVLLNLSQSLLQRGFAQEGLSFAQEALSIAKETGQKGLLADVLGNIGGAYFSFSDYIGALEYFHQALAIYEELGSKKNISTYCGNIGIVYGQLSDYPRTLEYLHQALAINEELGNKNGIAIWLGNIGLVYGELSDYACALKYLQQALAINKELGNKNGITNNLSNLGLVYFYLSDYTLALENYQQALAINKELGNKNGITNNLINLGLLYFKLSDYLLALENYLEALAINKELGERDRGAKIIGNLGALYAKADFADYNPAKAEEYLLQAIAISQELGTKRHLYDLYKFLADLYKQEDRWQEHAEYLQQYYETYQELQTEEAKKLADKFAFQRQIAVMEKEREVTDMLLHKFLPSPIVADVKAKEGKILVQQFNNISVLFADLVGFTKLSLSIKPEIMIEMLNFIFTKFDTIIKENGGHRIRTMGDGYFAICGAPDLVENHQYKLAKAALKFMEDIILPENIRKHLPEGTVLDIRIGLHCGEAVCGMVGGLEKWQYDAYGDTINTASRMESHGEAGKIHISEDFKHALVGQFDFIPREPMFIKGKGMMNTYFLQ